jgi:hypothetical protein
MAAISLRVVDVVHQLGHLCRNAMAGETMTGACSVLVRMSPGALRLDLGLKSARVQRSGRSWRQGAEGGLVHCRFR